MEKLCVNCKHHRETVRSAHECYRFCTQKHVRSNIDGSRVSICTTLPSSCSRQRDAEGRCGPDAVNFEASRAKWLEHKFYMFLNRWAYWVALVAASAAIWYFVLPR